MKSILTALLLLTQLLLLTPAGAAEPNDFPALRKVLAKMVPDMRPDSIKPAEVPGLYEVVYGPQIFYATQDGKFLLQGDLIDTAAHRNITDERRTGARLSAINKVGEDKMIIFAPQKVRHTITVFTDIDCGYCRKLHSQINDYLHEGIRVRYMFYPRSGLNTPSYYKAVSVWCAKDRNTALTRAKQDQVIEQKTCDNPVQQHMALGEQVGVSGTPTIVTETGRLLPGYVPPARMAQILEEDRKSN